MRIAQRLTRKLEVADEMHTADCGYLGCDHGCHGDEPLMWWSTTMDVKCRIAKVKITGAP